MVVLVSALTIASIGGLYLVNESSVSTGSNTSRTTNSASSSSSLSSVSSGPTSVAGNQTIQIATTEGFFIDAQLCGSSCVLDAPWPELSPRYSSLESLRVASSYVVEANVSSLFTLDVHEVPVTFYNITVIANLETSPSVQPGYTFTLGEVGGTANGTTMTVKGYPLVAKGQTYIFFLAPSGGIQGGGKVVTPPDPLSAYVVGQGNTFTFTTVGGPQGLFPVQAGKVYSLDNTYPSDDEWLTVKASGVPLTQFVQEVQSATSTTVT